MPMPIAAVGGDRLSRDIGRGIGDQEGDGVCDVFGGAQAFQGNGPLDALDRLRTDQHLRQGPLGHNNPWRDRIDTDIVLGPL